MAKSQEQDLGDELISTTALHWTYARLTKGSRDVFRADGSCDDSRLRLASAGV
jgi:hypothetical protein